MSSPLWSKGTVNLDADVQAFCAADDVVVDRVLFPHDIAASRAHVHGLARIGILSATEASQLDTALEGILRGFTAGTWVLDERYEDGHTAIETLLVEQLGDVGRKVHTGRSRNDQVLVAQRLYVRARVDEIIQLCRAIAEVSLARARATMNVPMPGYTHLQRAVPSSLGAWFAAWAEAFVDNALFARGVRAVLNANPLGTAAGYGVNLPLDRAGVAAELGFDRVLLSPIHAQNSRGKMERMALEALHQCLLDVRRMAWDLSLFATAEFGFVRLPDAYTTGSSLMPNKRNPDVVELLRQLPAVTTGALAELDASLALPSGYHRDLQGTKAPLVRALARGLRGLSLVGALLERVEFDEARMLAAISPDMHATDRAIELAVSGVPFREAYRRAAGDIPTLGTRRAQDSLAARISPGGMAAAGLDELEARLRAV